MSRYTNPFPAHFDANGDPLAGFKVFFGQPNMDPKIDTKQPFSDKEFQNDLPAEITLDNFGSYAIDIFLEGQYSIRIEDEFGALYRETPSFTGIIALANESIDLSTVADMVANTDLELDGLVDTLGYTVEGDPGNNRYRIVPEGTGTADGGSFIDLPNTTPPLQAKALFPDGDINIVKFGAVPGSDCSTAFTNAKAFATNKTLKFPPNTLSYQMTGLFTQTGPLTILARGAIIEWPTNAVDQGLQFASSNCRVYGGDWKGPQVASFVDSQIGLWWEGVAPSTFITGSHLEGAEVHNWGGENVRFRMCQDFQTFSNEIHTGRQMGINMLSCLDGKLAHDFVHDFTGNDVPEAWGITCTKNNGEESAWPRTRRVTITDATVAEIVVWTGIDTHGGESIKVLHCTVNNCLLGISMVDFNDGSSTVIAPDNIDVIDNTIINSTIAKTDVGPGIILTGGTTVDLCNNCNISDNRVKGHGRTDVAFGVNNFGAAIFIEATDGLILHDNLVEDAGMHGFFFRLAGKNLQGHNNSVKTLLGATGSAIMVDAGGQVVSGHLNETIIDVPGFIGVFVDEQTELDMLDTKFIAAATNWDQTGGVLAAQFLRRVDPLHVGSITWDPPSIVDGASANNVESNIPGCSGTSMVEVTANRDLQGMVFQNLPGDTDKNVGTITSSLHNNTGGAIDLASLTLRYRVSQLG